MRPRIAPAALGLGLVLVSSAFAQEPAERIRADLEALSDPALGARATSSEEAQRAAELLASRLEDLGARPLSGQEGFLLPFEFDTLSRDAASTLELGERRWQAPEQVRPLPFSEPGSVEGPVVFAGYGLRLPEGAEPDVDSYAGLDVDGKVLLILEGAPRSLEPETRAVLRRYADARYKALLARQAGARAVLFVADESSAPGETTSGFGSSSVGIPALEVGPEVVAALFASTEGTLAEAREELDRGNTQMRGFAFPDTEVRLEIEAARETRGGLNVAGWLPGAAAAEGPWLVLAAPYDGASAGGGESVANMASVLEVGRRLVERPIDARVVLAFWAGHEQGQAGSSAFLAGEFLREEAIAACLDFGDVGAVRDNRLIVGGVGSSEAWPSLLERSNVPVGFDLVLRPEPWLPSDSTSFQAAGLPALSFSTEAPVGDGSEGDVEATERIGRLGWLVARRVAQLEEPLLFVDYERAAADAERSSVRAYTGTIPGYTSEVEGLLLEGVMEGGPAEEAGLRGGDVIVEFAGQAITNVYDYTDALDDVKVGEPIRIVYLRDGERLETTLVPRARE